MLRVAGRTGGRSRRGRGAELRERPGLGDAPDEGGARSAETAYVITGSDLLELNQSLDSDRPAKVIYHSHPNGRAYFSPTDREVATSPWGDGPAYPVQQLVVGITESRVEEAALFAWSEEEGGFVQIASYAGEGAVGLAGGNPVLGDFVGEGEGLRRR